MGLTAHDMYLILLIVLAGSFILGCSMVISASMLGTSMHRAFNKENGLEEQYDNDNANDTHTNGN